MKKLHGSGIISHYKTKELRDSVIIPHYKTKELRDSVIIPHYNYEKFYNFPPNPNCKADDFSESLTDGAAAIVDLHKVFKNESGEARGVPGGGIRV